MTPIRCLSGFLLLWTLAYNTATVHAGSVQLFDHNIEDILKSNQLVFVNFYADWCRFSQMLSPTFEEVGEKIHAQFPSPGKVVVAKVDAESSRSIAERYNVNKYPTMKLFRDGQMTKKEYRGQRSVDAMVKFLEDQLRDTIVMHKAFNDLESLDSSHRHIIGYFESTESEGYKSFQRVSASLRDECRFHALVGEASAAHRPGSQDLAMFRPANSDVNDEIFAGAVDDQSQLKEWAERNCVPVVREITFENAEELTEEGLPFLILFYKPDHKEITERYSKIVESELKSEKSTVNFLIADGVKFAHPLHHIGKSESDLPVLAIDSFRHMYIFPYDLSTEIDRPGVLLQFIQDLHSGKLHREFHQGPDPTTPKPTTTSEEHKDGSDEDGHEVKDSTEHVPIKKDESANGETKTSPPHRTSPPESVFKKLAPSHNRYTIIRDEL